MPTLWDNSKKIYFERGVTCLRKSQWVCLSASELDEKLYIFNFVRKNGLRPIMAEPDCPETDIRLTWLLPAMEGPILDIRVSKLLNSSEVTAEFKEYYSLSYALGCLLYHCKQMVERYSEITESAVTRPTLPENPDRILFGREEKPFFEFEAIITAGFRAMECLRQPLWRQFGRNCSRPRSFIRVVESCTNIPDSLSVKIDRILTDFYDHAKEYRDCLEHYLSPAASRNFADMRRIHPGVWTMSTWLPKNPEVRQFGSFEYDSERDALTYAWEFTEAIVDLSVTVCTMH